MEKKEKFEYDIDLGAIMDYVENRFMLVIKDEDWTQEEIEMLNSGIDLHFVTQMILRYLCLRVEILTIVTFISMFKNVIGKIICLRVTA